MLYNHVSYPLSTNDLKMVRSVPPGGNWRNIPISVPSKRLEQIRRSGGRTTLYGRLKWDKPSYTVTTYFNRPGNGTYIHPSDDRVISAREAARLQSFPDNYFFCGSKMSLCKQIGNAVPPLMAFFVAEKIKLETGAKNVLDLFCGAGGLSAGFNWAGYNVVVANDNFPAACETYRLNHPKTVLIEGDITLKDTKTRLLDAVKSYKIDLIVGGPPCQGFSHAGKRLIDDPRNFLYREFIHMVKCLKPKIVLMENVEGLLTSNDGKTFENIKDNFYELGYKVAGKKLFSANFGVPQRRKRLFIIGVKKGTPDSCFPTDIITDENKFLTVKTALSDLPPIKVNGGTNEVDITIKPHNIYQEFMHGKISIHSFVRELKKIS